MKGFGARFVTQMFKQFNCELLMKSFVPRYELIAKAQARHEPPLLQPVDGTETSGEKDSLNTGEREQAFSECFRFSVEPFQRPLSLSFYTGDSLDSFKQMFLLGRILDVFIDEFGVCFTMNHFIVGLIRVKRSSF